MLSEQRKGERAEQVVAKYLLANGYQLLARNFRGRRGEIDLIALDGSELAFIEVKSRRSGTALSLEAVDRRKRRRIVRAALEYVTRRRLHGIPMRFDVAAVPLDESGRPRGVHYVRHAFVAERGRW